MSFVLLRDGAFFDTIQESIEDADFVNEALNSMML